MGWERFSVIGEGLRLNEDEAARTELRAASRSPRNGPPIVRISGQHTLLGHVA